MHTSGTASNYSDLLTKFLTFVTTGLSSGQNWTLLKDSVEDGYDRTVYLQAPGLTGTDTIFINACTTHNVANDTYNIGLWGATGFSAGLDFSNQPGISPGTWLLLWNEPIPYWFVADGRSAKIMAKVASTYQQSYTGFIIPYGTPAEFPYPLFIGACASDGTQRYSWLTGLFKAFWNPASSEDNNLSVNSSSGAFLRLPGGQWVPAGNSSPGNDQAPCTQGLLVWPYNEMEIVGTVMNSPDYALIPLVLHTGADNLTSAFAYTRAVLGEFDGVYFVSGYANASENLIAVDGENYIVMQNTYRTSEPNPNNGNGGNQYAAFALTTD